jgi:MFS transporter, NNP family, nitrate/nitrite transporter
MTETRKSWLILTVNTVAFTVCFMCWTMNGVLVTYLVDNGVFHWNAAQIGWLIGIPVLTGSITRLPVGMLTDKYGGKPVYGVLLLASALFMYLQGEANTYFQFVLGGLGFGLSGASFAVGIAYTSVWFSKEKQGTALGIFGAGNAGSAVTSVCAPLLLNYFTGHGADLENWRYLPRVYALSLLVTGILFFLVTENKVAPKASQKSMSQLLAPLKFMRVWRFGLYYFLVFGGFVALSQWLIPYYVNVYGMTVAMAGLTASAFSFPGGVIRAIGGWMSDHFGARAVMQWVLGLCLICFALLIIPRMDISSPGSGVMASLGGVVKEVNDDSIILTTALGERKHALVSKQGQAESSQAGPEGMLIFPRSSFWQEPAVNVGDKVVKKQLLARGITHIFFQANVWIFTVLVFIVGMAMAIGKSAVYRHIPDYFPNDVAVVGAMVGVLGGLGGFVCPIIFGYLLQATGLWTTCWMFFLAITAVCLVWMHLVIRRLMMAEAPEAVKHIEENTFADIRQGA